MPSFVSTKRAIDLQYEVENDLLFEGIAFERSKMSDVDLRHKWPIFGSILKKHASEIKKKVTFDLDCTVEDPLSEKAVLISGRQARLSDQQDRPSLRGECPFVQQPPQPELPGDLQGPPDFAQDLLIHLDILGLPHDFLQNEGCHARTWYLHHQHFPRWRVPRIVELDHDWSRWRHEIVNSWRDMIVPEDPVSLFVVHPNPNRHYLGRRVDVDIIVAQEAEEGLFAGLLTVDQQRPIGYYSFALAISLPQRITGRDLAQAADLLEVCEQLDCSFSFGWNRIPPHEPANHHVRNGQGFQGHFQIRNQEQTLPLPTHSSYEPAGHVDLMQNSVIKAKRPIMHNKQEAPAWYPHVNSQGGHEALQNHLLLDVEPEQELAEDTGDESGRSEDPLVHPPDDDDARQAVMMFHLDEAPVHAMLDWTDWTRMIREIAYHFAVDREEVLDCHEMRVRPPDIPEGIAPIIVQQVRDVPVGTAFVLLLVDIEVHGQWMEAHYGIAPIVERRVIAVPSLLSRNALISQARVFEYCRFEKERCLVVFNHVPWHKQDPDPKQAMFGDYAKILLPPSLKCQESTGEMLADSRQLTVEDFWARYYEPTTPSSSSSSSGSVASNVSPSLVDSDDIKAEFGPHRDEPPDDMSVMQLSTEPSSGAASSQDNPEVVNPDNDTCVTTFEQQPGPGPRWPLWFRHFFHNFRELHEIEDINEGPIAYLRTWYLDCTVETVNEDSRVVRISHLPVNWFQDIQQRWRDKIDPEAAVHFAWVYPKPPPSPFENVIGHLIVFQHPNRVNVPVLVNYQFRALRDGTGNAAVVIQKNAAPDHFVDVIRLDRICKGRRCTLHRGTHGGTWGQALNTGEGLKLVIPSPGERSDDELHWNPRGVAQIYPADVVEADPVLSFRIEDYPPFIQALHRLWLQQAREMPASLEKTIEISTWFLEGRTTPFNEQMRDVVLSDDFSGWENDIRTAWTDYVDVDAPLQLAFVHPVPPPSPLNRIHVLAFQHIPDHMRGAVLTSYDNALYQGRPRSVAMTVPHQVTREDLIRNAGLALDCDFRTQVQCSTWFEGTEILQNAFSTEHGFGFNLLIYRQALVSWETDELEEPDEQHLLQRGWSRSSNADTHTKLETCVCLNAAAPPFYPQDRNPSEAGCISPDSTPDTDWPKPSANVPKDYIKINMKDVIDTQEWLDTHFTLPCFDIEAQLAGDAHWHPASLGWIQMKDWFAHDRPVDKIRIYYDGSYVKANNAIGFASVAFVQIAGRWAFAGALSGRDTDADETASYKAELNAALITLKFLYDLVKVQHDVFCSKPACELVFDSLTVGNQTSGLWKSTRAIHECHLARSLLRLCEARFETTCEHFFSPGHSGEPGNELADTLAWCAAHGQPLQDWSTFLSSALKGRCVGTMEWAWMLHTDWIGAELQNTDWVCPQRPSTTPVSSALPSNEQKKTHMSAQLEFKLRFATCNVLTLRSEVGKQGSLTAGVEGPARLEWILKSFDDLGIHVFALQETRIRKVKRTLDDRYLLIKSQATQAGQYGMIIGLSKRHPFAAQTHPGVHQATEQLFFQADDYTIIAADPRILVVKIHRNSFRCILIAAHAPHTGATLQEIEDFWAFVDTSIPKNFADWSRVVLTDANCRLGSQPCERIGNWQAETMTEKSVPFAQFVVKSNVFLPATFEKYHIGESGTWQHQLGMWKRNDFIGLPCDWPLQACISWIPDNVDFSIAKEDHRTVCVECSWTEYAIDADLRQRKRVRSSLQDFCPQKLSKRAWSARPDFTVDVHTEAMTIQETIMSCRRRRKPTPREPRKETLSPQTWDLICAKKHWRAALHDNTSLRKATLQAMFFAAWRLSKWSNHDLYQHDEFDRLLCHQDQLIATALFQFQRLGREVTRAIRKDDRTFFESLTKDASEFLAPNQVKEFWKTLRRHLPKFRTRKLGHDPNRIEALQDQWVPYFQALEIGTTRDACELISACHARQCEHAGCTTGFSGS